MPAAAVAAANDSGGSGSHCCGEEEELRWPKPFCIPARFSLELYVCKCIIVAIAAVAAVAFWVFFFRAVAVLVVYSFGAT